ncbi:amino acid synthesis family protein [Pseudomonas sp. DSP3-2-2]|uniref:amino acid synthesis family protein n=1 Tax=unclassified Pseudomonas TaxID=196821 RepID=UPI003CE79672
MTLNVRKYCTFIEQTLIEGGKNAEPPITMVVVAAILKNPWAGKGFVENLRPEILEIAPSLGKEMTDRLIALMPADKVEAYGKAACVGTSGEIEHASGLIHTLRFGNMFREAVDGTAYLSFTNVRTGPGALISLPMVHKTTTGKRSHFLTATFQIADAPGPDEILVAIGAADGSRPHPRIADRFQDMAEMEQEAAKKQ